MLLNWLRPVALRATLPDSCMTHAPGAPWDGYPAFARTFWDDSSMTRTLARVLGFPVTPITLDTPDSCSYDGWVSGGGCRFGFTEPVSNTVFQVRAWVRARVRVPSAARPIGWQASDLRCMWGGARTHSPAARCPYALRRLIGGRVTRRLWCRPPYRRLVVLMTSRCQSHRLHEPSPPPAPATSAAHLIALPPQPPPPPPTPPQVGLDSCPSSSVPYVSVSCSGPWCANFMRPCSPNLNPVAECGNRGLICRKPFPGAGNVPGGQLLQWMTAFG
jgi:hypothetical protein